MSDVNTIEELLAAWDDGQTIWTIELGGLGPGYEQAIQIAAVEMARDNHSIVLPEDKEQRSIEWNRLCTATLSKHDNALGGLSGAQFGAASWLAYQWCHNGGPKALQDRAKEQNRETIMVSNSWPRAKATA